ncbi:hypothetical protein [Phenylobacterium aquaticum]|uniref:hypothetical protein n=1 Tax=Phenylobacterium aquaticum TaxID=1763816 RepID=UPI001F5C356C|nr:hypothetical protein [Phenylobacterium aquaticum]MCI3134299.1 hypothetical protein [Phenylobacterium aquaticum]
MRAKSAAAMILAWAVAQLWGGAAWAAAPQILVRQPAYADDAGQVRKWRLTDSIWGFFTPLFLGLADELDRCKHADPAAAAGLRMSPNRLDRSGVAAIAALRDCRKGWFRKVPDAALPEKVWSRLLKDQPPPTPLDRAKVLAFGAAPLTPDYDRTIWDWDRGAGWTSADPDSILSWGPFKATAGHGCTLQKALSALVAQPAAAALVREHFEGETAVLERLLDRTDPDWCAHQAAVLKPVFDDPERREEFRVIFARLAAHPEIRAGYDAYFLGPAGYLAGRMGRYYSLYAQAGLTPTETDFAFFLDRSLDYPPLGDALTAQLLPLLKAAGPDTWKARRIIANQTPFTSPGARSFQIGRDAVYWVDAVGQAGLDPVEASSWVRNSRLKASDVGLTERPYAPPCAVVYLPACAAADGRP